MEREEFLLQRMMRHRESEQNLIAAFQRPPLYSLNFDRGFGTLYTAAYRPRAGTLELRWPGLSWRLSLDNFVEGEKRIEYRTQPIRAAGNA